MKVIVSGYPYSSKCSVYNSLKNQQTACQSIPIRPERKPLYTDLSVT